MQIWHSNKFALGGHSHSCQNKRLQTFFSISRKIPQGISQCLRVILFHPWCFWQMDGILPYFPSKNTKFPICFCKLFVHLMVFGKEREELDIDAQVSSHPWLLSAPYFRCHHTDVSLSFHLLLRKSHFQIFAFFPLSFQGNILFIFCYQMSPIFGDYLYLL